MSQMRFGLEIKKGATDKAIQAIRNIEYKLTKKLLNPAVREASKQALANARAVVPVRTSLLKKSLKVRVKPKTKKPYVRYMITGAPEAWYGLFVEKGTQKQKAQHNLQRQEARTQAILEQYVAIALKAAVGS